VAYDRQKRLGFSFGFWPKASQETGIDAVSAKARKQRHELAVGLGAVCACGAPSVRTGDCRFVSDEDHVLRRPCSPTGYIRAGQCERRSLFADRKISH
jgi:hypothetical protein